MRQFDINGPYGKGRVEINPANDKPLKKQGLLSKMLMGGTVGHAVELRDRKMEAAEGATCNECQK